MGWSHRRPRRTGNWWPGCGSPPFVGDGDDLLLARQVVELVFALHGLAQRLVAWQHQVFSLQSDEQRALRGPRTYSGYCGECCDELLVWQTTQFLHVQTAVQRDHGVCQSSAMRGQLAVSCSGRWRAARLAREDDRQKEPRYAGVSAEWPRLGPH